VLADDDTALLRRLTEPDVAATADPRAVHTAVVTSDGRSWIVTYDGTRAKLGASKGMQYLVQLLRNPGVERHALDLVDAVEGVSTEGIDRRRLGDAGELLDAHGRSAYRREIEQLRSEIDDALARGDDTSAMELQERVDQLVAELARAFGLGGRARAAGSAAERARLNVTRALRAAVARIGAVLPEPGAALDRGIKTGLYCQFAPDPQEDVRFVVQS
jgi:hypothetical protein